MKTYTVRKDEFDGIELLNNFGKVEAVISGATPEAERLIAAAPELLEACKEALRLADSNSPGKVIDICDILRDAISKVECKGAA